ncbi:MAG: hypothetical protein IPK02_22655 [Candidatus Accumulibacter sp.]|uniref:Uncharacterized protein n=1 Tax=Candidatus Accumulibacter affinis TaxID=2954384 RepID=A0A935W5I4_9PROT|nr:hypothetical protein [Candidatus Accumulibacter affinis]
MVHRPDSPSGGGQSALAGIAAARVDGYWFGTDQAELATDILFKSRADFNSIHLELVNAAITGFGATDLR